MGLFTCRNDEPYTPEKCEWCGDNAIKHDRNFCIGNYCIQCDKFADEYGGFGMFQARDIVDAKDINGIAWFKRARDQYLAEQEKTYSEHRQKEQKKKSETAKALLKKYK